MDPEQDTEITLGTAKLLTLFFGLVVVCAVFFALGYTLGRSVPNIDKRIHYIIAAVIVVSLIPAGISAWRAYSARNAPPIKVPQPDEKG